MPSKANEYKAGTRLSNAAKAPMGGAPVMPSNSIGLPGGETLYLPRNLVQPQASTMPASPVAQTGTMSLPPVAASMPQRQAPAVAPRSNFGAVLGMGQQAPQAPAYAPSRPLYSTGDVVWGTGNEAVPQPGSGTNTNYTQDQIGTPEQRPDTSPAPTTQQSDQQQSASTPPSPTPGYSPESIETQKQGIMSGVNRAAQMQQAQVSDYYGRLGLSGSGAEQMAMAQIDSKAQAEIASKLAQFQLESENLKFQQEYALKTLAQREEELRLQGMAAQASTLSELASILTGLPADMNIPTDELSQMYSDIAKAVAEGGDPAEILAKFFAARDAAGASAGVNVDQLTYFTGSAWGTVYRDPSTGKYYTVNEDGQLTERSVLPGFAGGYHVH